MYPKRILSPSRTGVNTALYHTISHYTTLYHTIPHYTTLYHTIPHYTQDYDDWLWGPNGLWRQSLGEGDRFPDIVVVQVGMLYTVPIHVCGSYDVYSI